MAKIGPLTACLFVALSASQSAAKPLADVICERTSILEDRLSITMRSEKIGQGLRGPETLMEMWTSDRGDWTLVMTRTDGTSCIVAMGEQWADLSTSTGES